MKKVPEHVAMILGLGATPPEAHSPAWRSFLAAVLRSARRSGVRCVTLCLEDQSPQVAAQLRESIPAQHHGIHIEISTQGGRGDIVQAVRRLAVQVAAGRLRADEVDLELLRRGMPGAGLPDPDLIILCGRDNQRHRLSDRLLFEIAYSEIHFCEAKWSDFAASDWQQALADYSARERRFGKTSEQIQASLASAPVAASEPSSRRSGSAPPRPSAPPQSPVPAVVSP